MYKLVNAWHLDKLSYQAKGLWSVWASVCVLVRLNTFIYLVASLKHANQRNRVKRWVLSLTST